MLMLTVSIVTEKEWQEISTDNDSDEPVVASNKTIATSSVKARSKQSTLGAVHNRLGIEPRHSNITIAGFFYQ